MITPEITPDTLKEVFDNRKKFVKFGKVFLNGSNAYFTHPAFKEANEFVVGQCFNYVDYRANTGRSHDEAVKDTQSHIDGVPSLFASPYDEKYRVIKEETGLGNWKQVLAVLVEDTETGKQIQFRRIGQANGGSCFLGCWNGQTLDPLDQTSV